MAIVASFVFEPTSACGGCGINTDRHLQQVPLVARVIAKALHTVGDSGVVTVEESPTRSVTRYCVG